MSWKHLQFFGAGEEKTEEWINELYSEFARFFSENTLPLPERLKASIKGRTPAEIAKAFKDYWASERTFERPREPDAR